MGLGLETRSTTAADSQHLKVKEYNISLTKNYCITINIKIISFIHIFIFKIQVLGSHELKSHCHLWQGTLKNDLINFQLSFICASMQKSGYIFQSPKTRLATPIFDHANPINFWSAFNCCESAWTCQKSVYLICSFFR